MLHLTWLMYMQLAIQVVLQSVLQQDSELYQVVDLLMVTIEAISALLEIG